MPCSLAFEHDLEARGFWPVAGVDEVGRGPLAGPVVVAAVMLESGFSLPGLDDSKKLSARRRLALRDQLLESGSVVHAIVAKSPAEIDRINILEATRAAMREACLALPAAPAHVLVDGLEVPRFPFPQTAIVGGDGVSMSIAAASVLAKVERDLIMEEWDRAYPEYGFARHKGYPTREHCEKLRTHGPCPIHRHSFAPVAAAREGERAHEARSVG
jgi:ribonuclease HII